MSIHGKGEALFIIQIICLSFTWISVGLRLYTRTQVLDGNRWEDHLMYLAFVCITGCIPDYNKVKLTR